MACSIGSLLTGRTVLGQVVHTPRSPLLSPVVVTFLVVRSKENLSRRDPSSSRFLLQQYELRARCSLPALLDRLHRAARPCILHRTSEANANAKRHKGLVDFGDLLPHLPVRDG